MSNQEVFQKICDLANQLPNSGFKANLMAIIGAEIGGKSLEVCDVLLPLITKFRDDILKSRSN